MHNLGQTHITSALLVASAACSCALAAIVFFRNPGKRTHRVFAGLGLLLAAWSVGVLFIVHSHTESSARFWMIVTFSVASFIPAAIYHFLALFPFQRLQGVRSVLWLLYGGAVALVFLANTPWYIKGITVFPDGPPVTDDYGPVFHFYVALVVICFCFSSWNLLSKLKVTSGLQRRQVEHVCISFHLSSGLAVATNVLAPVLKMGSLQVYGPCFMLIMVAGLAYSMVRYHLLDVWGLLNRTTAYALLTGFVIAVFLIIVSLVPWLMAGTDGKELGLLSTALAAAVIAVVLQPVRERIQLILDRIVARRRYDAKALIERISREVIHFVRPDELLAHVAKDIQNTIGVSRIHVLLLDARCDGRLEIAYSTDPVHAAEMDLEQRTLVRYLEGRPRPLVLEQLLLGRPKPHRVEVAKRMAEIDAYLLAPLRTTKGLIGIMALGEKLNRDPYTREDVQMFGTLAVPLATAIESARLYERIEKLNLHMERVMASMRGGVVAVGADGIVTTVNQEAEELLGGIRPGQHISELAPQVQEVLRKTFRHGSNVSDLEMNITGPSGESIPVAISSSNLEGENGERVGAMVLVYNLTQIKRLESNVSRADRLTSIGTMAAGMAHEIKNPLQSIKTFTQLLLDRFADEDFRKTFAEVVPPEVQRIDGIVTRLLNFARPKPVVLADQNIESILSDVLALVANQTRKAGIEVMVDFSGQTDPVRADEQKMHQLFLNLILNALEAMEEEEEGGTLTVRVRPGRANLPMDGAMMLDVACVWVYISDTGCGIPTEHLDQLFTPFFTTKADGSGLGLSVVQRIVSEHGGEIGIESKPGEGTTFSIALPLVHSGDRSERVEA